MKRYVDELKVFWAALVEDIRYARPALGRELERDLLRLSRASDSRGIHLFMVDLPKLGKHLDRCLARGQYSPSALPVSKPVGGGVVIPKLFRGLYLLIFDANGKLKGDADVEAIFFLRQLLLAGKKANIPCPQEAIDREIGAFREIEGCLPDVPPSWIEADKKALQEDHQGFAASETLVNRARNVFGNERATLLLGQLDKVCGLLMVALGPFDPETLSFRHGPGAVSDVSQTGNRYEFRNWCERLERVFPSSEVANHDYLAWVRESLRNRRSSQEPSSLLTAVPKTLTKPRLIATEPSEMMFCQQGCWNFIKNSVKCSWIDDFVHFRDQSYNQALALKASMDGSLATIDLSAASDRVTPLVVGNLFRRNLALLQALASTRTRYLRTGGGSSDELVELRKYSTMGNATTFPVESLVFLAIVLAGCLEAVPVNRASIGDLVGKVLVFGDDLIVPNEKAGVIMDLLKVLYFEVNVDKTFTEGNFRESCGVDAFRGICVTPVYWHGIHDRSPESYASRVEVSNNLYRKFLVTASRHVQATTHGIRFPSVPANSGVLGYHSFVRPTISCPRRWNTGLQREEVRVPQIEAIPETVPQNNDTALFQFFTEEPDPFKRWSSGIRLRPVTKIRHRWVPTAQVFPPEK